MRGLRSLIDGGLALRELRRLRTEVREVREGILRIALALETRNAHEYPTPIQPDPDQAAVEVSYVNEPIQAAFMEIELRLTKARGAPPTEDEILQEFERLHTRIEGDL